MSAFLHTLVTILPILLAGAFDPSLNTALKTLVDVIMRPLEPPPAMLGDLDRFMVEELSDPGDIGDPMDDAGDPGHDAAA